MANAPLKVDLEACINGKKQAWDGFVRACAPLIFAAVKRSDRSRSVRQEEIEDRVQEVFVQLVKNDFHLLRAFDPTRASLSTYLTLVARSVSHQRQNKRKLEAVSLDSVGAIESRPVAAAPEPLPMLNGLTERQQAVLQMLYEQGLSVEEAAHRLEVDPQTIRSTKHKAMLRLRQQMKEKSADEG